METTGDALEAEGKQFFESIGLSCASPLNDVKLKQIDPHGSYSESDHAEYDYLIPHGTTCLVGEITSRNHKHIESKFSVFRRHFDALKRGFSHLNTWSAKRAFWSTLGVPSAMLPKFRDIKHFSGFMIATTVEKLEVDLPEVATLAVFFRYDWEKLKEYSVCIGQYTKAPFLDLFPLGSLKRKKSLTKEGADIIQSGGKFVTTSRTNECDVITFKADPYDLLTSASVDRRDLLPSLRGSTRGKYQRMLLPHKLHAIRRDLLTGPDFTFPGAILVVLSPECRFDRYSLTLHIPLNCFGAISVVDGQHRLFAYADEAVHKRVGDECEILVNALHFEAGTPPDEIERFSARLFIEINTNQTKVSKLHLEGIAFEILGEIDKRSVAAHILRKVNERHGKARGLFRTSDSPTGIIQIMELVGSLSSLTNPLAIKRLSTKKSSAAKRRKQGLRKIFNKTVAELSSPEVLAKEGVVVIERYYNEVASTFHHDWPAIGQTKNTSLELSKMHAAFIKLLDRLISEGADWNRITEVLGNIRDKVLRLQGTREYTSVLFSLSSEKIPNARYRISDMFAFLDCNRRRPLSITGITRRQR